MYSLFSKGEWGNRGGAPTYLNYRYSLKGLRSNLERVVHYNRIYPRAVKPNHFLVRLIHSLNVPMTMDPQRMVDVVSERTEGVGMAMNITSPLNKGRIFHPGVLYGEGSQEILIADSTYFDVREHQDSWEELRPLEFLYHPKTDLGMDLPWGLHNNEESGLSVIRINVPMLAFQYQQWRQREWSFNPENQRTVMQFIASYPLNNLLYSQVDWAILNRIIHTYRGLPCADSQVRKPFQLTDYTDRLQVAVDQMVHDYRTRAFTMEQLLDSIQLLGAPTALERVALPKLLATRQVKWALMMAREPLVRFLVDWNNETGNKKNRAQLIKVRQELIRFHNDNVLRGSVPKKVVPYWEQRFKELIDLTS